MLSFVGTIISIRIFFFYNVNQYIWSIALYFFYQFECLKLSRQNIKKYGANVFFYETPATMLKKLVSPAGERTITFVFL